MPTSISGTSLIRPQVKALPSLGRFQINPALHRLQWNENPNDFPSDLKEEVLQRLAKAQWSRYPLGLRAHEVIDALAQAVEMPNDQIIVGNGSSDILRVVISAIIGQDDTAVTLSPTFGSYRAQTRLAGGIMHDVPLSPSNGFALPVEALLDKAAATQAKLIVICAPNNPTGTIFPLDDLRRVVDESDAFVLLDAAYGEFCGQDLRPFVAASDRVAIVQTFSKAFGMAGVRVGYALAAASVTQEFQKLVNTFTLSPFSEAAAVVALENLPRFRPLIDALVSERGKLAAQLAAIQGITVYPSGTNFLLVHLGRTGKLAQQHLTQKYQLLVTDMGMYPGYEEYLRISVGSPEQNNLVVTALSEFMSTPVAA
jgi:histidinol-phosphate aminotransferase